MMKLYFLTMTFPLLLILTACNETVSPAVPVNPVEIKPDEPAYSEEIKPFEWGEISALNVYWWADMCINETFSIQKVGGQYYFNAYISGEVKEPFAMQNQPIPIYIVEKILNILKENQAESWNGFDGRITEGIEDWSGWGISVEMENGSVFRASGFNTSPSNESFRTVNRELLGLLRGLRERYAIISE